jgi:hypothetical protein
MLQALGMSSVIRRVKASALVTARIQCFENAGQIARERAKVVATAGALDRPIRS